jgi:PEGA domain
MKSSFRSTASVLTLLLATSLSGLAHAQNVSDADRKAARDLYEKGASLQVQGKPAEALDSFMRSYTVFPAPTTALHVAQCHAALGHLVEAEESYRSLANAKIPDGSPQAFYAAQDQAKSELAAVSPRLPTIRVTTTPDKIQGLVVKVDDQAMNPALVGVARAVNPGTHKVTATAPGYVNAEQNVTVQEKETRDVPLAMQRGAGGPTPIGNTTTPTYRNNDQPQPYQYQYNTGNSTWNAPYSQRTKRANGGLYGGGIALVVLGSIATLTGGVMMLAGTANTCSYNYSGLTPVESCSTSPGLIAAGATVLVIGVAGIVGGAIMISVGGKRVPATEGSWVPALQVGPTGGGLKWAF